MSYHDQLDQATAESAAHVLAALALYEAGHLTGDTLAAVIAAYIAAANSRAAALADLSLAAVLTTRLGTPVAPLGIVRPADDPDRLDQAAHTILASPNGLSPGRWERLARAEPIRAAADAYSAAIGRSRAVTGWRRGLSPAACQLCRWWWREGRIWPADHPMPRHTGCTCTPEPITTRDPVRPVRHH